jgi:hypothetical protein
MEPMMKKARPAFSEGARGAGLGPTGDDVPPNASVVPPRATVVSIGSH